MLANVLLRASGKGKLLVAATDLNVSVSAELASKNNDEGGITVGAKALFEIVSSMPGQDLIVRRTENNWAEIRAGKVTYRVVGMPDRDFPKIPDHREVEFCDCEAATLRDMIEKTLISVCNDETRFHLNGVLFECDGARALMVSTDGHRLSKIERTLTGGPKLSAGVIIPKKGLLELKRGLEGAQKAELAVKTPYLFVRTGDISLAVKLIEAEFPPYEAVIPKGNQSRIVVARDVLADALKRAQLMSSETRGVLLVAQDGALVITGNNPELGDVHEEIAVEYPGEAVKIGFNPKYVIEILGQMDSDKVVLEVQGELDPGLLHPLADDTYVGVVMPMRV
jgi:DNA polymerase-3 subunit beta